MTLRAVSAAAFGGALAGVLAYMWLSRTKKGRLVERKVEQAPGIWYDTVAREWRCRVDERKTLGEVQRIWEEQFAHRTAHLPGCIRVQRLCCGTCLDYRIVVSMRADAYDSWKLQGHSPEAEFLGKLRECTGVTEVQSQLLSIMDT